MKRLMGIASMAAFCAASAYAGLLPAAADLPKQFDDIQTGTGTDWVDKYILAPQTTTADARCGDDVIGEVSVEWATFTGHFPGDPANSSGGMLVRGGFKFKNNFKIKKGHKMAWVQAYKETGGAATHTIDTSTNPPFYPQHTVPGYDVGYFDGPVDAFANAVVPTAIDFETALVCWDEKKPKDLFAIGSWLWGYTIDKPNKTIPFGYNLIFSPPLTGKLKDPFVAEFGPAGTRDKGWTLTEGCDDCFEPVPEPATLLAMGSGLALMALRRRKSSK